MLELIALIGGFLGAALFGLPFVARLARPHGWRSTYPETDMERRDHWQEVGFEPLNFGPDVMRWPSETPWTLTTPKEVLWPSQTWNDTHFGQHWNRERAPKQAIPVLEEEVSRPVGAKSVQDPPPDAERQKQMRAAIKRAADVAQSKAEGVAEQAKQAVYEQVEQRVESATGVQLDAIPKPAELERLVGEVGLAGTVQIIMKRTNWDFRTAAQYLAKARRR